MLSRPTSLRLVAAVMLAAGLLAGLLVPASAGAATAHVGPAARAGGPVYGPWSDYFYDVRARVATPTKERPRAHVQVNRNASQSGDRQFRITWRPAGGELRSSVRKLVEPQGTITFSTAALPCGRTRLVLMGRLRAPGEDWTAWKSFGADVRRPC